MTMIIMYIRFKVSGYNFYQLMVVAGVVSVGVTMSHHIFVRAGHEMCHLA